MTLAGFRETRVFGGSSVDELIYESWVNYLTKTLGRSPEFARQRAEKERTRTHAREYISLFRSMGWEMVGTRIIDIGSGHGSLAVELALAGAEVTAVEPCAAWREMSEERTTALGLSISHSCADAHALPFPDSSFDACVSLQVLEHVRRPEQVIREMARVLKPGGRFFVSCENYLAFHEQHYGVAWLPCLPKFLGSLYLRLRGKDPTFLKRHITYTYWPGLAKSFMDVGLIDWSWSKFVRNISGNPVDNSRKARVLYSCANAILGPSWARAVVVCAKQRHRIFKVGFRILGQKQ